MIDARKLSALVCEVDGLTWLIEQAKQIKVQQLLQAGSQGISTKTRVRMEELMGTALEQLASEELDRVRGEIAAMGATVDG